MLVLVQNLELELVDLVRGSVVHLAGDDVTNPNKPAADREM
jgi:hypothetical protein